MRLSLGHTPPLNANNLTGFQGVLWPSGHKRQSQGKPDEIKPILLKLTTKKINKRGRLTATHLLPPTSMGMSWEELKRLYCEAGQGHVFRFESKLSEEEKASFHSQLSEIDVRDLANKYAEATQHPSKFLERLRGCMAAVMRSLISSSSSSSSSPPQRRLPRYHQDRTAQGLCQDRRRHA